MFIMTTAHLSSEAGIDYNQKLSTSTPVAQSAENQQRDSLVCARSWPLFARARLRRSRRIDLDTERQTGRPHAGLPATVRGSSTSSSMTSLGDGVAVIKVTPSDDRNRCQAPCGLTAIMP